MPQITAEQLLARAEEMRNLPAEERTRRIVWGTLEGKVIDMRRTFAAMQDGDCA